MTNKTHPTIDKIADYLKQIKTNYSPIEIKISDVLDNVKSDTKYYLTDFKESTGRRRFCIIDENEYKKLVECRKTSHFYDDINLSSYFWFNKGDTNTKKERRYFARRFIEYVEQRYEEEKERIKVSA